MCVALNIGGILLAGANTRGFDFQNDVDWAPDGNGIVFGETGLAYTDPFTTARDADRPGGRGFTIEIALRPEAGIDPGFGFIAVVHSGVDRSQLLIAQWRRSIIVMNGDDYDNRRQLPRLTIFLSDDQNGPLFLAIRSDASGTALYVNGKPVATRPDLVLRLPTGDALGRIVLGNNVYGDGAWRGQIAGFALHDVALDEETLRHNFELWQGDNGFGGDDYISSRLAYAFAERTGRRVSDQSANGLNLRFPYDTTAIAPRLFDFRIDSLTPADAPDFIINSLGFIPLGFFLVALFLEVTPMVRLTAVGAAIGIGLALSFGIELTQAWIPSRSSSLLDLLLNVTGSGLGGGAFALLFRPEKLES